MKAVENTPCQFCKSRKESLFNFCTADELEHLTGVKICQTFKKGQIIFLEGSRPSGLHCINFGKIKLSRLGPEGKEKIIRLAGSGEWVGYKALIANLPYSATAIALEDVSVCFIPSTDFMYVLQHNQEFQTMFTQLLCRNLSEAENETVDIAYKSVRERLAEALLLLKRKFYDNELPKHDFVINMTREDLANLIGTAKETVIRLLSDFKDEGIVESQGRKIVLKDEEALIRISELYD
ncbi:MAG: Crp/Fnr family transcriptional regulator [Bacteroidetes bacterium]|nr:Crp/Fnr family transcriptional regulator [Bacteroidota bacterium]